MNRKQHNHEAGYIAERANPYVPGTKVVIYEAEAQGIDVCGKRYAVVCTAHGNIVGDTSLPKARQSMKFPDLFCEACQPKPKRPSDDEEMRTTARWLRPLTPEEVEALKGPRQRYADLLPSLKTGMEFYIDACPRCGREVNLHPVGLCSECAGGPCCIVKRADGKVFAGWGKRGDAIFVEPTAPDHFGKSVPRAMTRYEGMAAAARLEPRGHLVKVQSVGEIYGGGFNADGKE